MASITKNISTYHVVPRFDMAAEGGPLFLGAIFRDLKFLRPALNRVTETRITVREELKYTPVVHAGFRETKTKIREGKFEAWVKVLSGLGGEIGGSANASRSSDVENTVACEEIVTIYFDPDEGHLADSFAADPVQRYLEGSRGWTADFYMITGIKVAKNLEYCLSNMLQSQVDGRLAGQDPQGGVIRAGVQASMAAENRNEMEFVVADIVVGYRVNKYRCRRRFNVFKTGRKVIDDGVVAGEMMANEEPIARRPQVQFEELPIPEETFGKEEATAPDGLERWVLSGA